MFVYFRSHDAFLRTKQPFKETVKLLTPDQCQRGDTSREAAISGRVKRKGVFLSWCRVSRFGPEPSLSLRCAGSVWQTQFHLCFFSFFTRCF
jgi:hypothetical protein